MTRRRTGGGRRDSGDPPAGGGHRFALGAPGQAAWRDAADPTWHSAERATVAWAGALVGLSATALPPVLASTALARTLRWRDRAVARALDATCSEQVRWRATVRVGVLEDRALGLAVQWLRRRARVSVGSAG